MRIGIVTDTRPDLSVWSNGLIQNILFLAQSLYAIPFVKSVDFIEVGDINTSLIEIFGLTNLNIRQISWDQSADEIDIIIEMGGSLPNNWLSLQRSRGKKVVWYNVGQPFTWFNAMLFDQTCPIFEPNRWDEVWLLPRDAIFIPLIQAWYKSPAFTVPYVWSPYFIKNRANELKKQNLHFDFSFLLQNNQHPPLKLAILEPNMHVTKNGIIPLLACDEAYRIEPRSVDMVYALNTKQMIDHTTLLHLANSLNIVKDKKATFIERYETAQVLTHWANAVISHQWKNEFNYLYFDVLFGNYPLIHNSPWLNTFGAGYYYPDFDTHAAGQQIIEAWKNHHHNLDSQKQATQKLFKYLDPLSDDNIRTYAEMLTHLCADQPHLLKV